MFVAIPTFLFLFPYFQIQFLLFFTSLYIIFYAGSEPHIFKHRRRIELFNEWWIMIMNYHLIAFSDFTLIAETKFIMGYSYIANMLFVVMVNIVALVAEQIAKCIRRRKQKAWLKKTENYREMIKRQIILEDKLDRRKKMRE
jgi:hypothetical protein